MFCLFLFIALTAHGWTWDLGSAMYLLIYTPLVTDHLCGQGQGQGQIQRKANSEGEWAIHRYHRYPGSVGHKSGGRELLDPKPSNLHLFHSSSISYRATRSDFLLRWYIFIFTRLLLPWTSSFCTHPRVIDTKLKRHLSGGLASLSLLYYFYYYRSIFVS